MKWKSLLKSPVVVADSTLSPRRLTSSDQVPELPPLMNRFSLRFPAESASCEARAAAATHMLLQRPALSLATCCPALSCPVLPCPVQSCPVMSSPVLSACCCPSTDKPPAACTRGPPTDSSPLRRSPRHRRRHSCRCALRDRALGKRTSTKSVMTAIHWLSDSCKGGGSPLLSSQSVRSTSTALVGSHEHSLCLGAPSQRI